MNERPAANVPGYTVLFIGVILSLYAAFVPHYTAGFRLNFLVFVTGILRRHSFPFGKEFGFGFLVFGRAFGRVVGHQAFPRQAVAAVRRDDRVCGLSYGRVKLKNR